MAYGVVTYNSSDRTVTVNYRDLGHSGKSYAQFSITIGGQTFYSGDYPSWNTSNEANLIYKIDSIPDGWYNVELHAKTNKWYPIYDVRFSDGNNQLHVYGGGYHPQAHPLTYIKLIDIISAEDGYVKVQIQTDGYGDVDLISVTKGWDLMGRYKNKKYEYIKGDNIRPDQVSDGKFYGTATYEFNKTDLSYFPSVPVGTCYIASGNSGITYSEYSIYSKPFLCMSEYGQWVSYDRTYATTLKFSGGQMFAGVDYLSSVKRDWTRLVNMSFYLEATTYGDIKYSTYSEYIPRYGDVITADMYNALLSSVYNCCERVGVYTTYLPSRVSSNQIISKNFIRDIGLTIDECLVKQKRITNERAVSN